MHEATAKQGLIWIGRCHYNTEGRPMHGRHGRPIGPTVQRASEQAMAVIRVSELPLARATRGPAVVSQRHTRIQFPDVLPRVLLPFSTFVCRYQYSAGFVIEATTKTFFVVTLQLLAFAMVRLIVLSFTRSAV